MSIRWVLQHGSETRSLYALHHDLHYTRRPAQPAQPSRQPPERDTWLHVERAWALGRDYSLDFLLFIPPSIRGDRLRQGLRRLAGSRLTVQQTRLSIPIPGRRICVVVCSAQGVISRTQELLSVQPNRQPRSRCGWLPDSRTYTPHKHSRAPPIHPPSFLL
jgi:hypothetical protein